MARSPETTEPDWFQRAVDAEETLRDIRSALRNETGLNTHSIADTIWIAPAETVVDRINAVLGEQSANER